MINTKRFEIGGCVLLAAAAPALGACSPIEGGDSDEDAPLGVVQQADLSRNDLSRNSLSFNDLSRNDLSRNALAAGALSGNALSTAGLGVQLIKYAVRCALADNVCIDVPVTANDTNVPEECVNGVCHFCGNLNLAPGWQTTPLSLSQEKWVSACLLAHVNIDGVSIPISVRDAVSGNIPRVQSPESNNYDAPEAAFYGNVFTPNANGVYEKYVCNAGASAAPPGRVCGLNAAGALDCAMTFTGSCAGYAIGMDDEEPTGAAACGYIDALPNGAAGQCHSPTGSTWSQVITIYNHELCGDGMCSGHEKPSNCPQDCQPHHDD